MKITTDPPALHFDEGEILTIRQPFLAPWSVALPDGSRAPADVEIEVTLHIDLTGLGAKLGRKAMENRALGIEFAQFAELGDLLEAEITRVSEPVVRPQAAPPTTTKTTTKRRRR